MSFGTFPVEEVEKGDFITSQLPFGFDVVWYFRRFLYVQGLQLQSQLPFGFDVVWYRRGVPISGARTTSHNCLSALMSFGTSWLLA